VEKGGIVMEYNVAGEIEGVVSRVMIVAFCVAV
jgi:hypothetical protein